MQTCDRIPRSLRPDRLLPRPRRRVRRVVVPHRTLRSGRGFQCAVARRNGGGRSRAGRLACGRPAGGRPRAGLRHRPVHAADRAAGRTASPRSTHRRRSSRSIARASAPPTSTTSRPIFSRGGRCGATTRYSSASGCRMCPTQRFAAFWELVAAALAPGGAAYLIDSAFDPTSTAKDHVLPGREAGHRDAQAQRRPRVQDRQGFLRAGGTGREARTAGVEIQRSRRRRATSSTAKSQRDGTQCDAAQCRRQARWRRATGRGMTCQAQESAS